MDSDEMSWWNGLDDGHHKLLVCAGWRDRRSVEGAGQTICSTIHNVEASRNEPKQIDLVHRHWERCVENKA